MVSVEPVTVADDRLPALTLLEVPDNITVAELPPETLLALPATVRLELAPAATVALVPVTFTVAFVPTVAASYAPATLRDIQAAADVGEPSVSCAPLSQTFEWSPVNAVLVSPLTVSQDDAPVLIVSLLPVLATVTFALLPVKTLLLSPLTTIVAPLPTLP